jgi:hypothetical protein
VRRRIVEERILEKQDQRARTGKSVNRERVGLSREKMAAYRF